MPLVSAQARCSAIHNVAAAGRDGRIFIDMTAAGGQRAPARRRLIPGRGSRGSVEQCADQLPCLDAQRGQSAEYDHRGKPEERDASDIGRGLPLAFETGIEMLGTQQQRPKQVRREQCDDDQHNGCEDAHGTESGGIFRRNVDRFHDPPSSLAARMTRRDPDLPLDRTGPLGLRRLPLRLRQVETRALPALRVAARPGVKLPHGDIACGESEYQHGDCSHEPR